MYTTGQSFLEQTIGKIWAKMVGFMTLAIYDAGKKLDYDNAMFLLWLSK